MAAVRVTMPHMRIAEVEIPAPMLAALQQAYAEPPRAYHHFGHVQEVLREHAWVAQGDGWSRPVETTLAVLYHDAIYVAGRPDNEARSAQLAREQLARWMPEAGIDVERVAQLIEFTARHGQWTPEDFGDDADADDTRRFLDCDMAILGAPPDEFDCYDRAIEEEYRGVVPRWLFRRKRRAFLRGLLALERIYLSDEFHKRLDSPARQNLAERLRA